MNKSISAISYNLLNLPLRVTIAGVNNDYTYLAAYFGDTHPVFERTHTDPVYGVNPDGSRTQQLGTFTYNVDKQGRIRGIKPIGGVGPSPSKTPLSISRLKTLSKMISVQKQARHLVGTAQKERNF